MKLGVVLARREDLELAQAMSAAARRAGDEVRWFVMDDGVEAVRAPAGAGESEGALDDEIELIACATSVDQRAVATAPGVQLGSQDDHAALLAWADRVVALT